LLDKPHIERLTVADLARREDLTLGAARVSPSTRAIRGPGGETTLEPRAMQVLVALVEAAGAVVTRDDLFRRCWGEAIVGDDSLNRAIADIRRAARTVAADSFEIETVPRTGYRLVVAGGSAAAGQRPSSRRRLLIAGGAGLAVAGAGGTWLIGRRRAASQVEQLIAESDEAMRASSPEGSSRAVELLEKAVALEPRDADAWGRLALAQATMMDWAPPGQAPATLAAVQAAARRALAISTAQPDALAALAILPPIFGDWLAAERRLRGVLAVAPGHRPTLDELAFLLVAVGRSRESAMLRLTFSPREPLHVGHQYRLIYAYWILGRIEDADRACERALQLWPKHPAVWFARLWVLAFTGRAERALAHVQEVTARPDLPDWMVQTLVLSLTGIAGSRPADVGQAVDRLVGEVTRGPSNAINALLLLNGLGAVDRAFDVAEAYLLEQGPLMASVRWRPGQVGVNDQRRRKTHMLFVPVTSAMRGDPRFETLVDRIGLSAYWRASNSTPDFRRRS
jgi:DNA-binding winged helix-turn-helix (wHTH) protein